MESNKLKEWRTKLFSALVRKKPISHEHSHEKLRKTLNWLDLIGIGLGCIIGAGIFVLTGVAARKKAGPAIVLSCYAEFSGRVPVAGSAYSYAIVVMGEFLAWILGWDLTLEYTIATAAVARGWSGYLVSMLRSFKLEYPKVLYDLKIGHLQCDITAGTSVLVITVLLCLGIKGSSRLNGIIVIITIILILFVIIMGCFYASLENWKVFFPFGVTGMVEGSATVLLAYVGFDAVSTTAEEAINPNRDLPIGIIGSLLISIVLYCGVAAVVTLMQPYYLLDLSSPLSEAFAAHGLAWAQSLVSIGAFAGAMLSQPRIYMAMARDGLLPEVFARVNSRFGTPVYSTVITGIFASTVTFLLDISILADLVSIGSLFAFIVVCSCVFLIRYRSPENGNKPVWLLLAIIAFIALSGISLSQGFHYAFTITFFLLSLPFTFLCFRMRQYDIPKNFKAPLVPLTPLLGIYSNVFMIMQLGWETWVRMLIWLGIGLVVYFAYGIRKSKIPQMKEIPEPTTEENIPKKEQQHDVVPLEDLGNEKIENK